MKNVEIHFAHFYQLYQFKRSSSVKFCQMDFEKKMLKGYFSETEILSAMFVFGATIIESFKT